MFVALAFIFGLALGFTLGVLAYLSTYALFMKWQEERTRLRVTRAEVAAAKRAQEMARIRAEMRNRYGGNLDASDDEVTEEVEKILGGGPQ